MELGIVSRPTDSVYIIDGDVVDLETCYQPGFKIGLGTNMNHDRWDIQTFYTWFRSIQKGKTTLNPASEDQLAPLWLIPIATGASNPFYYNGNETWKLDMDLLDLELSRTFFMGSHFVMRPFVGVRAAWIRQKLSVDYLNVAGGKVPENIFIQHKFHSWGVGPKTGFDSHWRVGQNFRFFGNLEGDIVFTEYRKIRVNQMGKNAAGQPTANSGFRTLQKNSHHPRPHIDTEFGIGWETACNSRGWHLDLTAGYSYQVFFGQNMFRNFVNNFSLNSLAPSGDLYIHGLKVTMRLDL